MPAALLPKSQHVRVFQEIYGASRYLKVLLRSSHCENPVSHHAIGTSGPRISQILICPSRLVLFNTKKNCEVDLELHIQSSRLRDHTWHSLPCLHNTTTVLQHDNINHGQNHRLNLTSSNHAPAAPLHIITLQTTTLTVRQTSAPTQTSTQTLIPPLPHQVRLLLLSPHPSSLTPLPDRHLDLPLHAFPAVTSLS